MSDMYRNWKTSLGFSAKENLRSLCDVPHFAAQWTFPLQWLCREVKLCISHWVTSADCPVCWCSNQLLWNTSVLITSFSVSSNIHIPLIHSSPGILSFLKSSSRVFKAAFPNEMVCDLSFTNPRDCMGSAGIEHLSVSKRKENGWKTSGILNKSFSITPKR